MKAGIFKIIHLAVTFPIIILVLLISYRVIYVGIEYMILMIAIFLVLQILISIFGVIHKENPQKDLSEKVQIVRAICFSLAVPLAIAFFIGSNVVPDIGKTWLPLLLVMAFLLILFESIFEVIYKEK